MRDPIPRRPPPTSTPSTTATFDRYVALGDSYTAAPLVPPTDPASICLRSGANYPALVAAALGDTPLEDVSCSGATTANATTPQGSGDLTVPAQLDAVDAGTDLVTIGLGGNDFGLFGTLVGQCTQLASGDPDGTPCRDALTTDGSDRLTQSLSGIRDNLEGVIAGVRDRAPTARILVIGYPQIAPASGSCDLLPLATGDYAFVRTVNKGLDAALRQGARRARAEYVDLWKPSAGHDICSDDPWINGRVTSAQRALAYHPLAVEQQAVADLIVDRLG